MAGPAAGLTWVVNDTQSRPDSPLVKTAQHQPGKHRAGEGPRPAVTRPRLPDGQTRSGKKS